MATTVTNSLIYTHIDYTNEINKSQNKNNNSTSHSLIN